MSDRLFGRKARLHVINNQQSEALVVENLRVQFKVKKTLKKEPNTCEIVIFNLSENTRSSMQTKGAKVILEAGYTDTIAQIFSGDARTIDHVHNGPNWLTKIQCGDGERAFQFARFTESFRPGTAHADVARKVLSSLGLDGADALKTIQSKVKEQFTKGYSAHGKASAEFDRLVTGRGLEWSVQDGKVQVLEIGKPLSNSAIFLSAQTGLVGSPEHGTPEKTGKPSILKVKSLLQSGIRPGAKLQIDSLKTKGVFRVETVTHTGDTHGGDWYSEAECLPL